MYYKVVSQHGSRFFSAFIESPNSRIEYKINKWVKPKIIGSPILIFDTYNNALKFVSTTSLMNPCIFLCEVKQVTTPFKQRRPFTRRGSLISFWQEICNARQKHKKTQIGCNWPDGTLYAKSIKLVEEVVMYQ